MSHRGKRIISLTQAEQKLYFKDELPRKTWQGNYDHFCRTRFYTYPNLIPNRTDTVTENNKITNMGNEHRITNSDRT